jgi:hypothetical protein
VIAVTIQDFHLLGKLVDRIGNEQLSREGFSVAEVSRFEELHDAFDVVLTKLVGDDWDDREALV